MPLPTDATGDIPVNVCCTGFFDAADSILAVAHDALLDCLPDGCDMPGFVCTAEPTFNSGGNYLAVWLQRLDPTRETRPGPAMRSRATFGIKLMETGWPTLESGGAIITTPDAERMHALSRHSYSHIERIHAAVVGAGRAQQLAGCCGWPDAVSLSPVERGGGLVGWVMSIAIGLC